MANDRQQSPNLDVDGVLEELRAIVTWILDPEMAKRDGIELDVVDYLHIANRFSQLDSWLTLGGALPKAWSHRSPGGRPVLDPDLN